MKTFKQHINEKRIKLMYIKDVSGAGNYTGKSGMTDGLLNPSSRSEIISFAKKNEDHCRIFITPDNRVLCCGGPSSLQNMIIHGEVAAGEGFDWKKSVRGLFSLAGDDEAIWMVELENIDKNKKLLARLSKGFKELMDDPDVYVGEYEDMW